ncbi:unnamed protein product [Parnassius apollo]|uniref:(apollo) hypothetical protein n=1 Tax=Parnassius apollo TaxID=110799 RepID=A0A8S3X6J4_PARAO|nr:unnamed protein product [Parnassius apollo]
MRAMNTVCDKLEDIANVRMDTTEQHVDASDSLVKKDARDIRRLLEWFSTHDPFPEVNKIVSIASGVVGDDQEVASTSSKANDHATQKVIPPQDNSYFIERGEDLLSFKNSMRENALVNYYPDSFTSSSRKEPFSPDFSEYIPSDQDVSKNSSQHSSEHNIPLQEIPTATNISENITTPEGTAIKVKRNVPKKTNPGRNRGHNRENWKRNLTLRGRGQLKLALQALRNREVGLNEASTIYGVPKATLKKRLGGSNQTAKEEKQTPGSAGDLTPELEEKLYQHILEMEACLYGLTPKDDYEFVTLPEDNDNLPAIENENMIVDPLFSELNDVDDNGIPKDVTSDDPPFSCTSVESTDVNTMQTIPSASKTPVIPSPDLSDNCNNINIQPETPIIATKEVKQWQSLPSTSSEFQIFSVTPTAKKVMQELRKGSRKPQSAIELTASPYKTQLEESKAKAL